MDVPWECRFAKRTAHMTSSAIRELLKVTERPEFISFAGGLPAPEVFPVAEVGVVIERLLQTRGAQALQYGTTEGYQPLRAWIAGQMTAEGFAVSVENVLITTGSQQAIYLLGKIFLDPGDLAMVEAPTYLATIQAWNSFEARYLEMSADADGIITERLEEQMLAGPKLLYTVPNFQNPTGVTLALERRKHLVGLARRHALLIVEDDPYRELRFEGDPLPRLITLDGAARELAGRPYAGNVISLGTFSKILAPGLRVGWVVAAPEVINKLVQAKQGVDLHTATLNQMIAYELAIGGFIEQHMQVINDTYRQRRDAMLAALRSSFPPYVHWTHPKGGMFLWVTLPPGCDADEILPEAIVRQVAFVPGAPFHANGGGANTFRLNFSNAAPEKITEGIARLGKALAAHIGDAISV
jgi:2-aminoadipate transaminase